ANSPKKEKYPAYVQVGGENLRGIHAMRVLEGKNDFTVDRLIAAAFDSYLTGFTDLVPSLIKAYDQLPADNPQKQKLAEPIKSLRDWDLRWAVNSVPTSVAVLWGEELWRRVIEDAVKSGTSPYDLMAKAASAQRLSALSAALDSLKNDYGKWDTPWGDINR